MGKIEIDLEAKVNSLLEGADTAVNSIEAVGSQASETKGIIEQAFKAGAEATAKYVKEQVTAAGATKQFNAETQKTVQKLYEEGKVMEALIVRHGSAKKALAAVNTEMQNMRALTQQNTAEYKQLDAISRQLEESVNQQTNALRELNQEYNRLVTAAIAAGGAETEAGRALLLQAGQIKDSINDIKSATNALGSDTKEIDALSDGISALGDVVQGASGVLIGLNDNVKAYSELQTKLTAVLAATNTAQNLANKLQTESKLRLVAAAAYQKIYTFVVGESTGALKAFRIALASIGVIGLVVAIAELIANFNKLKTALGIVSFNMEELNKVIEQQDKVINDLSDSYDLQERRLRALGASEIDVANAKIRATRAIIEAEKEKIKALQGGLKAAQDIGAQELKRYGQIAAIFGVGAAEIYKKIFGVENTFGQQKELRDQLDTQLKTLEEFNVRLLEAQKQLTDAVKVELKKRKQEIIEFSKTDVGSDVIQGILKSMKAANIPLEGQIAFLQMLGLNKDAMVKALQEAAPDANDMQKVPNAPFEPTQRSNFLGQWLTDEEKDKFKAAVKELADNVQQTLNTAFETAIKTQQTFIDRLDERIEKQKDVVANEERLARMGAANQLGVEQDKLDRLNAQREKALEKQKRLQNAQLAIDTAAQLSSLITAAAKTYESLAAIPGGVAVASALIASMFAAFAASKVAAAVMVNQNGFKEGGYTGDVAPDDVAGVVHGREFVFTEKQTARHRELFEGIYGNDTSKIISGIYDLLDGTGVTLSDNSLSDKLRVAKEAQAANVYIENSQLKKQLELIRKDLKEEFKKDKAVVTHTANETIITKGNYTRRIKRGK